MSIFLGLALEALLLVVTTVAGTFPQAKPILADLVQKVSWSAIVCMGLALGFGASTTRPTAMGIAGFLAAPLGFNVARALHKGAIQILGLGAAAYTGPSPLLLAFIKAVEYGCLGIALGRVGRRFPGALAPAITGLLIGLVFGGAILAIVIADAAHPLTAAEFASRAINEVIFPVGCSLVLYSTTYLTKVVARSA